MRWRWWFLSLCACQTWVSQTLKLFLVRSGLAGWLKPGGCLSKPELKGFKSYVSGCRRVWIWGLEQNQRSMVPCQITFTSLLLLRLNTSDHSWGLAVAFNLLLVLCCKSSDVGSRMNRLQRQQRYIPNKNLGFSHTLLPPRLPWSLFSSGRVRLKLPS